MSFDLYQIVTDRIIAELEKGLIPWEKPWTGTADSAISGSTGKPYSLVNQWLLMYPGYYYTFEQVKKLGGHVKKGEKSKMVVFWKQVVITETDEDGQEKQKRVPMLRYFNVFHENQCEGLPEREKMPEQPAETNRDAETIIQDYFSRTGITLEQEKSDRAYYSPSLDVVHLPLREQFSKTGEYYSTAFHEMTHSTGHRDRLNRIKNTAHFGNEEYSKEELVAEIGAAALCNYAGTETPSSFRNSVAYLQSWLRALRNDKKLIVTAAGQAEKAVNYILTGAIPTVTE